MIARGTLFGKAPARLVLLAGVLLLIATTALLAPSGAVAKVTKVKRPDVRIKVQTDPYYVIGGGRSNEVRVRVYIANRGRASTPVTYKIAVMLAEANGDLPVLDPVFAKSYAAEAIKPGEHRVDDFSIPNLPIGRYTLRAEAVTKGEVKTDDNVAYQKAFCVIPAIWRGTASLWGTMINNPGTSGVTVRSDAVPDVTFIFTGKTGLGFVYTAAGSQIKQSVSGGNPIDFSGNGTFTVPDQSTPAMILSEDMLVYDLLGLAPMGTYKVVTTAHGHYFATIDFSFVDWLRTGPKDKKAQDTRLAGTSPILNNPSMTGDFTWILEAVTQ
ncbi:MAG: hypothetical protein WCP21_12245 [Armatimonadota bacterium]